MKYSILLAFLFSLFLPGQTDQSTIRVSTRLVQISVVAHQKNRAVSDLTKNDFTLLEQGRPVPISLFSVNSSTADAPQAATTAPQKTPLPQNTFSNYLEQQSNRPSAITVILLDSINTPVVDQMYARQELLKFVRELKPQDRVAIYVLGRKLKILVDFTADAGEIQRTLAGLTNVQALEAQAAQNAPTDAISNPRDVTQNLVVNGSLDIASQMEYDFITESSVLVTLQALEAIANHVSRIPGRKNLVWISSGFPLSLNMDVINPLLMRRNFGEETKRATRLLNEANVAIYPVDARGLIGFGSYGATRTTATRSPGLLPARRPGSPAIDNYPETLDSMKHLALLTGGRAFYNSMDIKGALRSAIDDTSVTYTLGFYADPAKLDDKFHEIKVEVKRPGVEVRYRRGYFAFKDEQRSDQQVKQELADALWSPLDATAIPLVMRLDPVSEPEPGLLRAYLAADLHSLTTEQANGHWQGAVDVLIIQQDKAGKALDSSLQTLALDLDQSKRDAMLKTGVPLGKYLRPKPGLKTVRAIVMDRVSGKIGSLIVPIAQVK